MLTAEYQVAAIKKLQHEKNLWDFVRRPDHYAEPENIQVHGRDIAARRLPWRGPPRSHFTDSDEMPTG